MSFVSFCVGFLPVLRRMNVVLRPVPVVPCVQQPLRKIEAQTCLSPCSAVSCAGMISEAAFNAELQRLAVQPPGAEELLVAQRSLVRYERQGPTDDESKVCANEDWVRLFVALRRAHPIHTRITPGLLRQWKSKVTSSTSVKRKCYLVETAALDALPQYPPDLDKWIIPREELVLPADIYTEGILIIDDGYDRAKLNVPGILHIECAAKWSQERPSQGLPGRSSGSTDDFHPEPRAQRPLQNSFPAASLPLPRHEPQGVALAAPLPLPRREPQGVLAAPPPLPWHGRQGVALAAPPPLPRDELQSVVGVRQSNSEEPPAEQDNPARALQNIIGNAMKAVEAKRWVSSDVAQPNTVELWVRIFKVHLQHAALTPHEWTLEHKAFVKYITRECLASTDISVLDGIVPHLKALDDMAASNMPALAKSICKLVVVDLAAAAECERSEATFHAWLQEHLSLAHIQLLYCSPLYKAFLTRRFTRQLELAQANPGNRAESIRVLLESAKLGSSEHAALLLVQSLERSVNTVHRETPLVAVHSKAC